MRPDLPRFSRSSASVYYTERKPKNKKRGRPGNEAIKKVTSASIYMHTYIYMPTLGEQLEALQLTLHINMSVAQRPLADIEE